MADVYWPVRDVDYKVVDEEAFRRNPLRYNPLIRFKPLIGEISTDNWERLAHQNIEDREESRRLMSRCWRCREGASAGMFFGPTCKDCLDELRGGE